MTEFSFEDFMARALYHDIMVENQRKYGCPEALKHSDADVDGKCSYCRRKIHAKAPMPESRKVKGDLDLAYDYHYNPDYGISDLDRY